jgi:hypothetical protein
LPGAVRAAQQPCDEARVASEARVKALAEGVDTLRSELGKLAPALSDLTRLRPTVDQLASERETSIKAALGHAQQVQAVAAALEETRRDVTALLEDRTQTDRITPLANQIAEIERLMEAFSSRPSMPHETKQAAGYQGGNSSTTPTGLRCELLETVGAAAALQSHTALASAFADALLALGLRKSSAQVLGEECTAAIASRQAVFLQGAFATRVARALARAVSGPAWARLAIPIGLQDGEDLRRAIAATLGTRSGSIAALAIEGINRAALDITREIIADCIDPIPGAANVTPVRIAVFAALTEGLASLPAEPD